MPAINIEVRCIVCGEKLKAVIRTQDEGELLVKVEPCASCTGDGEFLVKEKPCEFCVDYGERLDEIIMFAEHCVAIEKYTRQEYNCGWIQACKTILKIAKGKK